MKRKKSDKIRDFKADIETIRNEDVRKLQQTFDRFFGSNPAEMKKQSLKLKNKVYFYGLIISIFFVLLFFISKNVKFVGI